MMGTSHAVSGAAAWIALTSTSASLPSLGWFPNSPAEIMIGSVVCAGAALLPDADHHDATIAHSIPGIGQATAAAVGAATGGHRKGMHSLLAVVGVTLAVLLLSGLTYQTSWWPQPLQLGAAGAVCACAAFALKSLSLARTWISAWIVGATISAGISLFAPTSFAWLPICIGTGYLTHLLGDALTVQGVPFLWPLQLNPPQRIQSVPMVKHIWLPKGAFAVPLLGSAGSMRENLLLLALIAYVVWGVYDVGMALIG